MHGFSNFCSTRTLAIPLVILLGIFGTAVTKLNAEAIRCCAVCPSCSAQHEAAKDRARADKALKRAQEKAAEEQAEADRAIQRGSERAARHEGKAQARLTEGIVCNACGQVVGPTCKAQHEAAEHRARAEKAVKRAAEKAAEEQAQANQALQDGNLKAAHYEARANSRLMCNVCGGTTIE